MRYLILCLTIMVFALGSCNNEGNKASDGSAKSNKSETEKVYQSCDEFLDAFETWSKTYITTLRIFKSDPSNPKLAQRYSYQTRELKQWTEEWTEFMECADEEQYLNRYTEISEKINKEQKKLEGK